MKKKVISIIGSGGKTTVMLEIANNLKQNGKKVAITTTTKIFREMNHECIDFVCDKIEEKYLKELFLSNNVIVFGENYNEKLTKPSNEFFKYVLNYCDYLIIEADGSRQKPIKITKENEPIIIDKTDEVIAVFGLSAIGKNAKNVCHRYCEDKIVDIDFFCNIIKANIKDIDKNKLKIILNQADTENEISVAKDVIKKLNFDNIKIAKKGIECEF